MRSIPERSSTSTESGGFIARLPQVRSTRREEQPCGNLHGPEALEAALSTALSRGAIGAESVAHLLAHSRRQQHLPPALEVSLPDDPRVRAARVQPHSLSDYDTLLRKDSP